MYKAKISELKNRLSYYLRHVRRGESVLVYDRDRAIARIDPVASSGPPAGAEWTEALEEAGTLRPPTADLPPKWTQGRVQTSADVVDALLDERRSGR